MDFKRSISAFTIIELSSCGGCFNCPTGTGVDGNWLAGIGIVDIPLLGLPMLTCDNGETASPKRRDCRLADISEPEPPSKLLPIPNGILKRGD